MEVLRDQMSKTLSPQQGAQNQSWWLTLVHSLQRNFLLYPKFLTKKAKRFNKRDKLRVNKERNT